MAEEVSTIRALEAQGEYQEYLAGIVPQLIVYDFIKTSQNLLDMATANKDYIQRESNLQETIVQEEDQTKDKDLPWLDWHLPTAQSAQLLVGKYQEKYGMSLYQALWGSNRPSNLSFSDFAKLQITWTDWFKDGKVCDPNLPGAKQYSITFEITDHGVDNGSITLCTPFGPYDSDTSCKDLGLFSNSTAWTENEDAVKNNNGDNAYSNLTAYIQGYNDAQSRHRDALGERERMSTQNTNKVTSTLNENANQLNNCLSLAKELCDLANATTQAIWRTQ